MFLGALRSTFLSSAAAGYARAARANPQIGNFNALRDLGQSDLQATVALSDLKALERELKKVGPKALAKFKRDARKLGKPAQMELRKAFSGVGIHGPLGAPTRRGRNYDKMSTNYSHAHLSWLASYSRINTARGIDVNYKNRNERTEMRRMENYGDGTVSIVRLIVRAPALIVADMAGKSNRARKSIGDTTRDYEINLFGRRKITTNHVITYRRRQAIGKWLQSLDRRAHNSKQRDASRYAWPTAIDYMPKHKANASKLFNDTIQDINRLLNK